MVFGVGIGYKFVNVNGLVLDFNVGGGRTVGLYKDLEEISVRGCILIGYRF